MKDELIKRFIVDEDQIRQNTQQLVERVLKFGRVSKNGDVIIEQKNLSQENILKLALVLRFLAHTLDETIPESFRPTELTKVMGERLEAVGSRLSRITKDGFSKKDGYGKYVVHHYMVEKFLSELEDGKSVDSSNRRKTNKNEPHQSTGRNKNKKLTSISLDIQSLIDSRFFDKPKFVKDVQKKLEEEVKFHDIRIIDTTIRKTFVVNRKSLKRIPNTEKGKAKWKYVVRR